MSHSNFEHIKTNGLTFSFEEEENPIFSDLSMTIHKEESVLLLGPSGSGKSTLALCLNKLYPEAIDGRLHGSIVFAGKNIINFRSGELNQKIGMVFQDPESQFCMVTVEDEVAFGLENMNVPPHLIESKIDQALDLVGLTTKKYDTIHSLSGGQKQKLALACVLALEPELLILDEPTANLDPVSSQELAKIIRQLKEMLRFTLIVIEHKLDDWVEWMDRCLVLDSNGNILFDGDTKTCFLAYASFLKSKGIWLPKAVELGLEAKDSGSYQGEFLPLTLDELSTGLMALPPFDKKSAQPSCGRTILEVSQLSLTQSGRQLLKEINFSIRAGEIVALLGANGAGKTTLSKCITGLLPASDGEIVFNGLPLSSWKERELWKKLGYVFQNPEHQLICETVFEEIAFGLRMDQPADVQEMERMVNQILIDIHLEKSVNAHPFSLSQGQKRRLSVATMLVLPFDLLILDEPTFGQDAFTAGTIMSLLEEKCRQHSAILMITHDMNLVDQYADRVLVLEEGEIIYSGAPDGLWDHDDLLKRAKLKLPFREQLKKAVAEIEGNVSYAAP
jgi:energy-coupling factor transport system ATP-binding protein